MGKIRVYKIFVDGIDKCGKDTVVAYVDLLSGHKYAVKARGVISQIAYAKLYNRDFEYDISSEQNTVHVMLDVDKEDWLVRCKITREPKIDYEANVEAFEQTIAETQDRLNIIRVNSSRYTAYEIAKYIIEYATALDRKLEEEANNNAR